MQLLVVYDQCGGTAHGCMGLDNRTSYCADKVGAGADPCWPLWLAQWCLMADSGPAAGQC
jgi:hypothetical protein